MADAAYSRRDFAGGAVATTITGSINSSDTSITLAATTGWPSGTAGEFFVVINKGNSTEEKVRVDTRSGSTLTVTASGRGADGTTAAAHSAGESIDLCVTAFDLDEANKAVAELVKKATTAGQVLYVSAANEFTALSIGASGRLMVSDGSIPAWVAMSGDATITSGGVLAIGASKITNAMMADDAVDSAEIADGAVDTVHIADLNVTTGKINDLAVTSGKMAASSVVTSKISDLNVTSGKLEEAARPRWCIPGFLTPDSVGTATQMHRAIHADSGDTAACYGIGVSVVAPEAGSLIGVSVAMGTARTGGSLTFEVYKNGVASGLTAVIDGSNTQYSYGTQATNTDTFVAGDRLDVRMTSASFTGGLLGDKAEAVIWCQVT